MSRIVAGTAGGRRLQTPEGATTRPTTDRVREAFFSVVASWNGTADAPVEHQLEGVGFLDLYAGSGAMGLEAASRGADPVLLVESHHGAQATIEQNLASTGLAGQLRRTTVEALVAQPNPAAAFDIIWLDPPYDLPTDKLNVVLASLLRNGWVRADGVVVVERSGRQAPPVMAGTDAWDRRYGETTLFWFAPLGEGAADATDPEATDAPPAPADAPPEPAAATTEERP